MKKYLVIVLAVFVLLCAFTACKSGEENVNDPAVTDPVETSSGDIKPVEKEPIDWETPIDVDDSFIEDSSEPTEGATEPVETDASGETKPQNTNPVEPSEDPTEAPEVTEAPTSSETQPQKPGSSGAIELPMIPG